MTIRFTSKQIKGKGRGKFIGYPTINLEIPPQFELRNGVYAVWVTIAGTRFRGGLHWGSIPTFEENNKSLEVYILGLGEHELSHADLSSVTVEIAAKIRDIIKFPTIDSLTSQIARDIIQVRKLLKD